MELSKYRLRRLGASSDVLTTRPLGRRLAWWVTLVVVAANIAYITWLWLAGGGMSAVHHIGDLATSIGRITGLLAAFLLLLQVLLLARLPWVERAGGFDRLTVWHRINGKIAIVLVLAHVVFITVGYALTDRFSISKESWTLLTQYSGMVTATIGTLLLILTVVTSLVVVRRKLRYESWYLVHLFAYLGILLSWFHQIPTGNEFAASPGPAAYWTALYLITLALVVLFRVMWPALSSLRYRLRVAEVHEEGTGVVSLRIEGRHLDRLGAQPGQFFLWRFLTRGRWWEAHPFSLSAAPDGRSLRITARASGDFTRQMHAIPPGTKVIAEGPFGLFTRASRKREGMVLVAGGIGITPIRALLEEMPAGTILIYRVRDESEIIFREEINAIARIRGIIVHYIAADHLAPGARAILSPDHLRALVPDLSDRQMYICGPPIMVQIIVRNARLAGVPASLIRAEQFAL